jgi:uncharacterized damage-inducible protein DinB
MWGGTDDLIVLLRSTPVVLRALVREIDDERGRATPGGDEWSIVAVVAHLADADEKGIDRIEQMTTEDVPTIEGYDQVALAEERGNLRMNLSEALVRFEHVRAKRIAALEPLGPDDWERTGRHTQEGIISLRQLTLHMCRHDAIHLEQIARMVAP